MQIQQVLRHATHLVRRFFGFLRARPLRPGEQLWVTNAVDEPLRSLFFDQSPQDQRHALSVAREAQRLGGGDEVIVAALVHDVGKRHADLGAVGRSLATILQIMRLPMRGRYLRYRSHGSLGADDLRTASAPGLAISFAELHPQPAPDDVDSGDWEILLAADHGA
ncbi:MAG: hypothetical protein KJP12_05435 [Acidimicrobiia bacterium]|nr:hypothetical protein [Acidimicrobiia bacterium]MBT8214650.1 hypothetical protein [Acidimicrobiia bacterium]NNK91155.1 hypothetical protein [Acidimicrobiia bacterium]